MARNKPGKKQTRPRNKPRNKPDQKQTRPRNKPETNQTRNKQTSLLVKENSCWLRKIGNREDFSALECHRHFKSTLDILTPVSWTSATWSHSVSTRNRSVRLTVLTTLDRHRLVRCCSSFSTSLLEGERKAFVSDSASSTVSHSFPFKHRDLNTQPARPVMQDKSRRSQERRKVSEFNWIFPILFLLPLFSP